MLRSLIKISNPIYQAKVRLSEGKGYGDFFIPLTYPNWELPAYSLYQMDEKFQSILSSSITDHKSI